MNKELKNRVFEVPKNILDWITAAVNRSNGNYTVGVNRAKKILADKTVNYGQLKKIIHELKNLDKVKERDRYDLYGGELMDNWASQYLQGERDLVSNRKDSKKRSDDIGGLTGERKNSHLKKHTKKTNFNIGSTSVNLMKSNSHKTSVSPLTDLKLFEEVEKIKNLINY